ncbi:mitochondrial carrier protein mtm1 [Phtheirospermum japonicum]|uniref:Mitochondrial carrier protein mtm1 n=1 Tax=Phtheirospermum japonicum TaxID=374723 RepID=A0A830C4L4_9LAMI|nr:mitochondrial carrier protein mtm1 [Phtheirospermum japonicum]
MEKNERELRRLWRLSHVGSRQSQKSSGGESCDFSDSTDSTMPACLEMILHTVEKNLKYMCSLSMFADLRCSPSCARAGVQGIVSICPPDCFHYKGTLDVFHRIVRHVLDDDYSKIAFLCTDRSVCLHAKYGSHYNLRIPRDFQAFLSGTFAEELLKKQEMSKLMTSSMAEIMEADRQQRQKSHSISP